MIIKRQELKFDVSHYHTQREETTKRKLLIEKLVDDFNIAKDYEIIHIKKWDLPWYYRKPYTIIQKILPYYYRNFIKEQKISFDPNILKCPMNCYLSGFWQSYKYFNDIKIHNYIKFKSIRHNQKLTQILNLIKTSNSIAIHIRRGDYLSPHYKGIYHILDNHYYNNAIKLIESKVKQPIYFLFGDHEQWVPETIKTKRYFLIKHDEITDLFLLTQVKHIIISNSTFAWWGAWLNKNKEKIVIAPLYWYANKNFRDFRYEDLIPKSWLKI